MKRLLLSVSALALSAGLAHATCVSTAPIAAPAPNAGTTCTITAVGSDVKIVLAYAAAADIDLLSNSTTLLTNRNPLCTEVTLTGLTPGQALDLSWKDTVTGVIAQAGIPAADGKEHIAVQSTYIDYETDPPRSFLTAADLGPALTAMENLAPISDWVFVGFEDRLQAYPSDWDFNDLVVGMLGVKPVDEPSALAILGLGLLILGWLDAKRRKAL